MSEPGGPPPWDFAYTPIAIGGGDQGQPDRDLVLATADDVDPAHVVEVLAGVVPDASVVTLFSGHPLFWTRVQSSQPIDRAVLEKRLAASGTVVRYIASARRGSQRLPPPLDCENARPRHANDWKTRPQTSGPEPPATWRWFLRAEGVDVVRSACGTGAGARLALVDNDGRDLDRIDLDAEVLVGVEAVPRAASHAALLMGWAVGAQTAAGMRFRGVAPDASVRFYCIPKAGDEIVSLPLAIVRAVEDGADVIVCATYVEGQTSPLLDDALEFASRLGRNAKGTAVVLPTGREMSSPPGSVHSSLSLGMGDPASDPRVFCVGPSSRDGGWFLWRDRHGKLRPFANRGPALRWLAPGDDMAFPFASDDRPTHAESSGASGIAAGVMALVAASNPELTLSELETLLCETASPLDGERQASDPGLADCHDLRPMGRDEDGHNAKHGYGKLSARAACLCASDPIALVLTRLGEANAALRYLEAKRTGLLPELYGANLAHWSVRAILHDAQLTHALAAVARTCRLAARHPNRARAQPPGHLLRQLAIVMRLLLRAEPPAQRAMELANLEARCRDAIDGQRAQPVEERLLEICSSVLGWGEAANRDLEPPRKSESGLRTAHSDAGPHLVGVESRTSSVRQRAG